ncbi:MBL fold metallo-hydrolase [Aquimarina litoralis]|uniref:MBL fold metallo-hydrolase n=1 Tax=Aquimarina litoralis TaxID=584605 RepID=UPI001C58E7A9|nr:RNAse Z [Aquimarina litoralis]
MKYNITSYSTALFSTWINVEELNLLIDAGDGLSAGLLQKSRKIKNVFITHPDRDHLNGLPQFVQLNARDGFPRIHYPKDSGSFPAMSSFLKKFDPHVTSSSWVGIEDSSRVEIKNNILVEALRNKHIKAPQGVHKSFGYKVYEVKHKLKTEFQSKSSSEIKDIVNIHGREFITEKIETNILSFSGDTPVDDYSKWDGSEILIHESTFLKNEGDSQVESKGNKHSRIDEVLQMVKEINIGTLILNHFSSRYSKEEIDSAVLKLIKEYKIQIPVFLVYPGEIKRDILRTTPINGTMNSD